MSVRFHKTLHQLRSTRDLRAEMLALAACLANNNLKGRLTITAPVIGQATVQQEWNRMLPAIAEKVRNRLTLTIENAPAGATDRKSNPRVESNRQPLDRPNYTFEVLRLLLGANLENDGPHTVKALIEQIGASQTPIREALLALKQAGIASSWGRGLEVIAEDLSVDLLAKIRALPQTLRFRFEQGAQLKPPAVLLSRALSLLGPSGPTAWELLSLSGTPVARAAAPALDLIGTPRLDLVAHVPRDRKTFDANIMRSLDDGLEVETNVLAPAPVVVTLVRADTVFARDVGLEQARCAYPMDVFLALLDLGLRKQAMQYAEAARQ